MLLRNLEKIKRKIYNRSLRITPNYIGKIVYIHKGSSFLKLTVTEEHVGFCFGEFCTTRKKVIREKSKKKKSKKK